ncbi:carbohydrate esterase family 4 protein [Apiospora aurea]|uniref:Carbohydrate esterase family 4 protein n=1 Tax=Apiospora aurea TaxID=335848 RepID=A0ABR1QAU0_9PEZI
MVNEHQHSGRMDQRSMTSISVVDGSLTFTPKADSYFYETFPCTQAKNDGYNAVSFSVVGPAGGAASLEIQTKPSCSASAYSSSYFTVSGLTGSKQTVTVPLSSFSGAKTNAITGLVWSSFSKTGVKWALDDVQFVCSTPGQTTSVTTKDPAATGGTSPAPSPSGSCSNLLIDDWESQSRLTFLYYNAMIKPSSDDATMNSVVVSNDNHVTFNPKNTDSLPRGAKITVQLSSPAQCGDDVDKVNSAQTSTELGWTFDGTEKLYSIPFSKFSKLDLSKIRAVFFTGFTGPVTFGPMAFYCGSTPSQYQVPSTTAPAGPTSTVPAPSSTASALVIDDFASNGANALGFWHGGDEEISLTWGNKQLTIKSSDSDYAFYTQVSGSCRNLHSFDGSYLHIAYSGSSKFSIALQQHNSQCNENIAPFPETWDSLEAARYASATDIYIPISHFNIDRSRVIGLAFKGFYTTESVVLKKVEIVSSIPASFKIPSKLPSGNFVFACKRPNSFAFAIDDGDPALAQQVMRIVREEDIKVTFFTVGAPLEDASTNLTNVYREMQSQGHQIALHSFTHPKMEGLPDYAAIDWEYSNDIATVKKTFDGLVTPYFRAPFGNEGARMRQRLAVALGTEAPYIVQWSVDVEDWLYATGPTPEKQLDAFKRDLAKGGNLVVMHYLYPTTVGYLKQFIQLAKATGKQLMRVDQCMEDPSAPLL